MTGEETTSGCFACGAAAAEFRQLNKPVTLHAACYPGLRDRHVTPGPVAVCARCEAELGHAQGVKFATIPTGPRGLAAWLGETFVREQAERGKVWMRVQMPGGHAVDQMGDPDSYGLRPGERVIWTDSRGQPRMRVREAQPLQDLRRFWYGHAYNSVRDFTGRARDAGRPKMKAPSEPKPASAPAQRPWVTQELPRRCPTCRGRYTGTFARCPQCGRPREETKK